MSLNPIWSHEELSQGIFSARIDFGNLKLKGPISAENFIILDHDDQSYSWPVSVYTRDNKKWEVQSRVPNGTAGIFRFRLKKNSIKYSVDDQIREGPEKDLDSEERMGVIFSDLTRIGTSPCPDTRPPYAKWTVPQWKPKNNHVTVTLSFHVGSETGPLTVVQNLVARDFATPGSVGASVAVGARIVSDPSFGRNTRAHTYNLTITPPANYHRSNWYVRIKANSVNRVINDQNGPAGPPQTKFTSPRISVDNRPPSLDTVYGPGTVDERTPVSFTVTGSNITKFKLERVRNSGEGRFDWLLIDSSTGEITSEGNSYDDKSPNIYGSGTGEARYSYKVTAENATSYTDSQTFVVTVRNTDLPSLSTIQTQEVNENTQFSLTIRVDTRSVSASAWALVLQRGDSDWLGLSNKTSGGVIITGPSPSVTGGTSKTFTYQLTAGNNAGTASQTFTITVKDITYVATWSGLSYNLRNNRLTVTLSFSHNVTGLHKGDFAVTNVSDSCQSGWTLYGPYTSGGSFISSSTTVNKNTIITLRARPPSNTNSDYGFGLESDSIKFAGSTSNNGPAANTYTPWHVTVDNRIATASWGAVSDSTSNTGQVTLSANITFSGVSVSSVQGGDFQIQINDSSRGWIAASRWRISVNRSLASDGGSISVSAIAPSNITGYFRFQLKTYTIQSGVANFNNTPLACVNSSSRWVNSYPIVGVSSFTAPSGTITGSTSTFSLTLTRKIYRGSLTVSEFNPSTRINSVTPRSISRVRYPGTSIFLQVTDKFDIEVTNPSNSSGTYRISLDPNTTGSGYNYRNGPPCESFSTSVTYDTRISATISWGSASGGTSLSATITFSNASASGIAPGDFEVWGDSNNNSRQSNWTINVPGVSSSRPSVTVSAGGSLVITATTTSIVNDDFKLRILANRVSSNGRSIPSTFQETPNTARVDNRQKVEVCSLVPPASYRMPSSPNRGTSSVFILTLDTAIESSSVCATDFSTSDTSATVDSVVGTSVNSLGFTKTYNVTVTNPIGSSGSYTLTILTDTITAGTFHKTGPSGDVTSASVYYNTQASVWWTSPSNGPNDDILSGRINFSNAGSGIRNINPTDFVVIDSTDLATEITTWTIVLNNRPGISFYIGRSSGSLLVTATPPANTNGSFKLRLKANSVRSHGSSTGNAPINNIDFRSFYSVDNRSELEVTSFTSSSPNQSSPTRNPTSTFTLTLNQSILVSSICSTSNFSRSNTSATINSVTPISPSGSGANRKASRYTINVTNPTSSSGYYTITLITNTILGSTTHKRGPAADTDLSDGNDNESQRLYYNTYIRATALWSRESGGTELSARLTFSGADITGLGSNDFLVREVVSRTEEIDKGGWDIDVPGTSSTQTTVSVSDGNFLTITATPQASNINGTFRLRLKATSVRSDGVTSNNAPINFVDSGSEDIDTRPELIITLTPPPSTATNPRVEAISTFSLTFDQLVPVGQINTADFLPIATTILPQGARNNKTRRYNIEITNPTNSHGQYTLTLGTKKIDGAATYKDSPVLAVVSNPVHYETRSFTATWGTPSYTGGKLQARIRFSHTTTGIETTDFEVIGITFDRRRRRVETIQTSGWTFDTPMTTSSPPTQVCPTTTLSANTNILIAVTPPTNINANFEIRVKANQIKFARKTYNNGPDLATSTSPTVNVDSRHQLAATLVPTPPVSTRTNRILTARSRFTLTFSRSVPIEQLNYSNRNNDFTLASNTSIHSVTVDGSNDGIVASTYTIQINNPRNALGEYSLILNANAIPASTTFKRGPTSAVTSALVYYDTRVFTAIWGTPSYCETSDKVSATIRFSHSTTGIETGDFQVLEITINAQNEEVESVQTGWTFDIPTTTGGSPSNIISTTTVTANTNILISVTPPANTNGSFKLRVQADYIKFDGESNDNGPDEATTSSKITINNTSIATVEWDNEDGGDTLSGELTFNDANVWGIESGDFQVRTDGGSLRNDWTIVVSSTSVSSGQHVIVTATPQTANTYGDFKLRITANSVESGRQGTDNAPTSFKDSDPETVDIRPSLMISIVPPPFCRNKSKS